MAAPAHVAAESATHATAEAPAEVPASAKAARTCAHTRRGETMRDCTGRHAAGKRSATSTGKRSSTDYPSMQGVLEINRRVVSEPG